MKTFNEIKEKINKFTIEKEEAEKKQRLTKYRVEQQVYANYITTRKMIIKNLKWVIEDELEKERMEKYEEMDKLWSER